MKFGHDHNRRVRRLPLSHAVGLVVAVAYMGALNANVALAQGTKIGVANPAKIAEQLQETKDFNSKVQADITALKTEQDARAQKIREQKTQRDMFKADSQQYIDADEKLLAMSLEFENYFRFKQASLERRTKKQMIDLFKKIAAACGAVAKQKGLDVVISDIQPDIPTDPAALDQLSDAALRQFLAQRDVLYSSDSADISSDVIVLMDRDYKAGK